MTTHTGQFHSILIGTVTVHFKGTRQSVWPVFTRLSTIDDVINKSPALIMADNSGHRPFYKYTHTNAIYRHDISIKNTNTISSSDSKRTIKKCDCQLNYTNYVSISSSYHAHVKGNKKKNSKTKNCVIIYHRPNCKQNLTFYQSPKRFQGL